MGGTVADSGARAALPAWAPAWGQSRATHRAPENPILRPENVRPSREDFQVIGVFNAGVSRFPNGIFRVWGPSS